MKQLNDGECLPKASVWLAFISETVTRKITHLRSEPVPWEKINTVINGGKAIAFCFETNGL
jgi:hypothetical protein